MRVHSRGDRGQLAPLFAVLLLLTAGLALALAYLGGHAVRSARAQTAADAAALAGAAGGHDEAADLATANGGVLEDYRSTGDTVEVVVRVGDKRAVARATHAHSGA